MERQCCGLGRVAQAIAGDSDRVEGLIVFLTREKCLRLW